jgi:predicted AAA+ superfamily ATPase
MKLLSELIKEISTVEIKGEIDITVSSVSISSKNILEGAIFIAIVGNISDGHDFINSAIENGAKVIVHQKDLENYQDLAKLSDPISYLENHSDKLIILDEIQRKPDIFMVLRGLIDKGRQAGRKFGQFLILGSASIDLLRQSSESLAGRITYVEMNPISVSELPDKYAQFYSLWIRGGLPDSLLAGSDEISMEWRQSFIKTYLERDIPQFDMRIPAETLRRLWIMLAHSQGQFLNIAKLSASLGINGQTISRYIDLLQDLFLLRKLQPWHNNAGKRLIRSPKIYVRDSGILHALLNIQNLDNLLSNPAVGKSWEGFVIDNLLSFLPIGTETYFYRSVRGAEIDLIIKHPDQRLMAIEIKRSSSPTLERGFYEACKDIKPTHKYVIYDGKETFALKEDVVAISLQNLLTLI